MKKIIKSLPVGVLSAIVVLGITYFSLAPRPLGDISMRLFPHSDKVAHFLMYFVAVIAFLTDYAKAIKPHHTKLNIELALLASAMLLGLILEIIQLAMNIGRGYDTMDIFADCIGALAGFGYMKWKGLHAVRRTLLSSSHHHRHKHRHHRKSTD
ncbi:MAG: VanZ family protein [Muribaculaceae bacterium]|nr:VanZ family protein [Muribaculaceae bacterium]